MSQEGRGGQTAASGEAAMLRGRWVCRQGRGAEAPDSGYYWSAPSTEHDSPGAVCSPLHKRT